MDVGISKRVSWAEYFFNIAHVVSSRATCPRKQVGCIIVLHKRVISTGYNGAPVCAKHCTEVGCNIVDGHCKRAKHAEINALEYYLNNSSQEELSENGLGLEIYCTLEPCDICAYEIRKYIPMAKIFYEEKNLNK